MSGDSRATYHFKLVLLGNAGVGKSCLVLRFVRDEFYEEQETTIGGASLRPMGHIPIESVGCICFSGNSIGSVALG